MITYRCAGCGNAFRVPGVHHTIDNGPGLPLPAAELVVASCALCEGPQPAPAPVLNGDLHRPGLVPAAVTKTPGDQPGGLEPSQS